MFIHFVYNSKVSISKIRGHESYSRICYVVFLFLYTSSEIVKGEEKKWIEGWLEK